MTAIKLSPVLFQGLLCTARNPNFMGRDFFADRSQRRLQNRKFLKCIGSQCIFFCSQFFYCFETRGLKLRTELVYGEVLDHRTLRPALDAANETYSVNY